MAEFLTRTSISDRLEKIIKNARDRIVIISPFLRINNHLKELLEEQNSRKLDIRVIYGKSELHPEENNWLASMSSIRTSFRKNLHAKCYLNENEALLTSMNLYEFSQVNNDEMGLIVSKEEDHDLYAKILDESMRIVRASEEIRVTVAKVEPADGRSEPSETTNSRKNPQTAQGTPKVGFCIRCKATLPADPAQPYCKSCYASWRRFENKAYEEKHCHMCGNTHPATLLKPLCLACFKKYKDAFKFAAS